MPTAKAAPEGAGDIWTWVGLDAESKLAVSWYVGGRDSEAAMIFMDDLAKRLANRVQLTSDGHKAYLEAVEGAFGSNIDYAMLVKVYGPAPEGQRRYSPAECIGAVKHRVEGNPDPKHVSTSYAERQNLNIRMGNRRMTRLTNAFSKKAANHASHDGDLFHALQFRAHPSNAENHAGDGGRRHDKALGNVRHGESAGRLGSVTGRRMTTRSTTATISRCSAKASRMNRLI